MARLCCSAFGNIMLHTSRLPDSSALYLTSSITVRPDGLIPYDGVPIEMTETVELPLTVLYSLLATAGIIFAIICLVFNFHFRKQK